MIEMRWLLDPKYHDHPKDLGRPCLDSYTLQYRYRIYEMDLEGRVHFCMAEDLWSEWIEVPYVSE